MKETRVMPKDEAIAFIQNMRWFAGFGSIKTSPIGNGDRLNVTATKAAWSNWMGENNGN